ncbi:MAG: citrate synthase [Acidobacteria bacterium]|nr:citrate synthase [Acidobacteriota bacterium]
MNDGKEAASPAAGKQDGGGGAAAASAAGAGLRGVVAASSAIGDVNGEQGVLIYQGYDIHDLAEHSTFEETIFLLWNGRLPRRDELDDLKRRIGECYELPPQIIDLVRTFPKDAEVMDMLTTAVSALTFYAPDAHDISREAAVDTSIRLTAQFPVLVAAIERIRTGLEPVAPRPDLNIAANFLYMLKGEEPSEREARIFDVCLVLHADHELNASTFTARVVAGTLADVYASVTAALGALSGPLHGGANTNVMKMLLEIGDPAKIDGWIKQALAEKRKIMGIGHAVYKTEDPRATHLRRFSREMGEARGETKWFEILYTPIFAVSRISGWTGHILEQYANNKLIRPRAEYIGKRDLKYVPVGER